MAFRSENFLRGILLMSSAFDPRSSSRFHMLTELKRTGWYEALVIGYPSQRRTLRQRSKAVIGYKVKPTSPSRAVISGDAEFPTSATSDQCPLLGRCVRVRRTIT
jgi:hypothetical protein